MTNILSGNKFDRRRFLIGTGGTLLAVPMLESLAPRRAFAQAVAPPKRLIVVTHEHGRVVGGYDGNTGILTDSWSPGPGTMALPAPNTTAPSAMLAALSPITNEIVTIDGIDNMVRHLATDTGGTAVDGHFFPDLTCLNCVLPTANGMGGAASIDYVVGSRLSAGTSITPSIVFDANSGVFDNGSEWHWGLNGTPANLATGIGGNVNPANAINNVFAGYSPPTAAPPPPTPTLAQRLMQSRGSILDSVLQSFNSLRAKVNAADQARLDQHADFIRSIETNLQAPGGSSPLQTCTPPNAATAPDGGDATGSNDNLACPAMVNLLVQALACDLTRAAGFCFENGDDPSFSWMFNGPSPFSTANWHGCIHEQNPIAGLTTGYQFYGQMFTLLVQSLANMQDSDGSRMLDNTLVVWVSPMGYGSHQCFNIPVVMAGGRNLGGFSKGQGRHVVCNRNTLGDLWAQVLRMFGGSETTFGATGTLASNSGTRSLNTSCPDPFCGGFGFPGYVGPDTPLHCGPIDL